MATPEALHLGDRRGQARNVPARDSPGIPGTSRLVRKALHGAAAARAAHGSPLREDSRSSSPSARWRARRGRARLQRAAGVPPGLRSPRPLRNPVSFCSFLPPPPQDPSPKGCSKTPRPAAGGPLIPWWEREQPCDRLCNTLGSLTRAGMEGRAGGQGGACKGGACRGWGLERAGPGEDRAWGQGGAWRGRGLDRASSQRARRH